MWCMDTIKKIIKLQVSIKKLIGVYIGVLLICVLALVLPAMTDKQEKDYWIEISSEKLESQGEYPYVAVEGNPYFVLDNFSESIVLNCIYNANADQVWKDTLAQKRFAVSEEEITNLRILATGGTGEFGSDGWQRMLPYWMGCRSFLRLLLNVTNYMTIRGIIQMVVYLLAAAALALFADRTNWRQALFLGLAAAMMNLPTASSIMAQALMFMITFINVIIVSRSNEKKWWGYLFFAVGMVTVYFDWFTFPVMTYCVPMLAVLCIEEKDNSEETCYLNHIFEKGVLWCFGYILMLLSKTAISGIFAGNEAMSYFLGRVTSNAGVAGGNEESFIVMAKEALLKCFNGILPFAFTGRKVMVIIMAVVVVIVIFQVCRRKDLLLDGCIAFSGILVPVLWITVFRHFYEIHYWFGYRVLFSAVFAILLLIGRKAERKV